MNGSLPDDIVPIRRPHFHAKAGALYFLISRKPHAPLEDSEKAIWDAIDGRTSIANLRNRFADVDNVLHRFADSGTCDLPPVGFPSRRRRILVIEPHMDDAGLSVGGTMWLRRNECEFTVLSMAGASNFTSYYLVDRDFFDIAEVTALRKAESVLFLKHVGGHHLTLDLLEAPLRYRNDRWTLDWFRQHRDGMWALVGRAPASGELEEWTAALERFLANFEAEEIWMPLGVGNHVDHQLARDACLQILSQPGFIKGRKVRFYEEMPYTANWPGHADRVIAALKNAGTRLERESVNISEVMRKKLDLLSIFASQFKIDYLKPVAEKSEEILYEVVTPPCKTVDPVSCYVDSERVFEMAQSIAPWVRRHKSASLVRLLVPTPFGRWAQDIRLLLDFFPQARLEVFMARARVVETETLSSPRIQIRPIDRGQWYSAAGRLLLSWPSPLVIVESPGRERQARWLSAGCVASDPIVAPSLNVFTLALRLASVA